MGQVIIKNEWDWRFICTYSIQSNTMGKAVKDIEKAARHPGLDPAFSLAHLKRYAQCFGALCC